MKSFRPSPIGLVFSCSGEGEGPTPLQRRLDGTIHTKTSNTNLLATGVAYPRKRALTNTRTSAGKRTAASLSTDQVMSQKRPSFRIFLEFSQRKDALSASYLISCYCRRLRGARRKLKKPTTCWSYYVFQPVSSRHSSHVLFFAPLHPRSPSIPPDETEGLSK